MLASHIVSTIITSCQQPHYHLLCMSTVSFPCLTLASGTAAIYSTALFSDHADGTQWNSHKPLFIGQFWGQNGKSTLESVLVRIKTLV